MDRLGFSTDGQQRPKSRRLSILAKRHLHSAPGSITATVMCKINLLLFYRLARRARAALSGNDPLRQEGERYEWTAYLDDNSNSTNGRKYAHVNGLLLCTEYGACSYPRGCFFGSSVRMALALNLRSSDRQLRRGFHATGDSRPRIIHSYDLYGRCRSRALPRRK